MNAAGSLAPVAGNFIAGQWEPARPAAAVEERKNAAREEQIGGVPE
jgi:hypothetical protein